MAKTVKTNAMRILEKQKISYEVYAYDNDEFLDGVTVASLIQKPVECVFKTLVTLGASRVVYVFVIPVAKELSLKAAARAVDEKSIAMLPAAQITAVTGYIKGGCSPVGMKKQYLTILDSSALLQHKICVSAGKRGEQIELDPRDLISVTSALTKEVAE